MQGFLLHACILTEPAHNCLSCNDLYRSVLKHIGEAIEDNLDPLALLDADIHVSGPATDSEMVDLVRGQGEDKGTSDQAL